MKFEVALVALGGIRKMNKCHTAFPFTEKESLPRSGISGIYFHLIQAKWKERNGEVKAYGA